MHRTRCHPLLSLAVGLLFLSAFFFLNISPAPADENDIEITGLLINHTKTRIGNDFYRYFTSSWQPPVGITGYNLIISEKPSAQYGSWIWIKINDTLAYKSVLARRSGNIQKKAQQATGIIQKHLMFKYASSSNQDQPDMYGDGL